MSGIWSKYKMCCRSEADFSTTQKALTVAIRRAARLPGNTPLQVDNVTQLSYFKMATGWARHVSDWVEEKRKRTTVKAFLKLPFDTWLSTETTNNQYLDDLRQELMVYLKPLIEKARSSFEAASPAFRAVAKEDLRLTSKERGFRLKSIQCSRSWSLLRWWAGWTLLLFSGLRNQRNSNIHVDYTIMSFATADMEKALYTLGMLGTMVDYEDFNYLHTLEAKALVFDVLLSLLHPEATGSDMAKAFSWCRDACMTQWCDSHYTQITQGLFSGQRGTQFLKTILNVGYFLVAKRHVSERLGIDL